jgi:divalent metal cation (Fe/Co/Zn/Cd) transporter
MHATTSNASVVLLFLGMKLARRPPDGMHPFGHGKNVYFWPFVVSVMLFTAGGGLSIWEAARKVIAGGTHLSSKWAYAVLGGSFLFEAASLSVAIRSLAGVRRGRSLRKFWRETRDPTLVTVLLEDTAALVSLAVAAGLALAHLTGRPVWDAVASAIIGVLLIAVAMALAFGNAGRRGGSRRF